MSPPLDEREMGFKCGIVGLPNVGKSTLFNALTQTAAAQAANYPFCTIEPNVGDVAVPEPRLDELARSHFGLAAAVMALEGPDRVPAGWRPLAEGQADLVLGDGRPARLGVAPTALGLFGARAEDIGSVALVRLTLWTPPRTGVLAFGAASAEAFAADMGHELLDFLARVVERTAERWPLP